MGPGDKQKHQYKAPANKTLTPATRLIIRKRIVHACIQLQNICLSKLNQVDQYRPTVVALWPQNAQGIGTWWSALYLGTAASRY